MLIRKKTEIKNTFLLSCVLDIFGDRKAYLFQHVLNHKTMRRHMGVIHELMYILMSAFFFYSDKSSTRKSSQKYLITKEKVCELWFVFCNANPASPYSPYLSR